MPLSKTARRATLIVGATLMASCVVVAPALAATPAPTSSAFHRTATYPVYLNAPAGADAADTTAAEISGVTDDGKTVIYTDAPGKRIGFLDITDVNNPVGAGSISLADLGHADDQPTSVAVYGDYVLVVVDESGGDFVSPSGRLDVIRISDRSLVTSIDLGGQPDSIAIGADKKYAAIAIENQRDEDFTPTAGKKGDLPQLPAGFVQVIDLNADPTSWVTTPVPLVAADGAALPSFVAAGLDSPTDPEPEYVTINSANQLAVTLQENNGIALIDLPTRAITKVFSAGTATVTGIDTKKDKVINLTGQITNVPREPDSIAWVDDTHLATANEGDWKGGTRGWTIFDASTGDVSWDAGNSFEHLAVANGVYADSRADKKGSEPEGLMVSTIDGTRYGFVASERSNFVAVYDLSDPVKPVYQQMVFATNGPEGLLAVPSRNLLVASSETDDASVGVRASVALYQLGDGTLGNASAGQPSIVSDDVDGLPIGWQALGALSAKPGDTAHIYTASDSAVSPSTIFTVDVTAAPARIDDSLVVTENGKPAVLDIEGLHAREQGGFWLAAEGATGDGNALYRTDAAGGVQEKVSLPTEISDHISKWGFEGVTATTDAAGNEQLYVAVQRPLWADPAEPTTTVDGEGVTRIGRYDVTEQSWTWFGYQLEAAAGGGDWMGLSEIVAVDESTLAVIERDKLNGPAAAVKRIYTVTVPEADPAAGTLPVLPKTLAHDVLPDLAATNGWTQEKLEGLTIGADGNVYAVTDNDGLKDATGETVFLNLGTATEVFGLVTPTPTPTATPVPTATATATPTPTPTGTTTRKPSVALADADLRVAAGSTVGVSGRDFAANAELNVVLHSAPVRLGAVTADAAGAFSRTVTIPANTEAGVHRIVVTAANGETAEIAFTVVAAKSATAALANTGVSSLAPMIGGALALLAAGAGTLLIHRRQRA
ncbi:esterase-like activity of phytase family protein [Cryobacterium sp. TMB1-7]|uniref:esterase-like activity of phytase family protein n=1 Tax=Cryobacterium sp. TMB1-7 TaxID=2555866 RepID=UPI00106ACE07|nr:esterase-like activity of phytase family protein [Cryobacterium sp. TMB1-7]TFC58247.1 esterase-like activity of phytase family protein [Cryobacterium sp. TMB1-7]